MKTTVLAAFLFAELLTIMNGYSQQFSLNNKQKMASSNAQFMSVPFVQVQPDLHLLFKRDRQKDLIKFRNGGIALSAVGVATIVVGIVMVNGAHGVTYYNSTSSTYGGTQTNGSFSGAMGALGIVGGSLAVIGGGFMWYIGNQKIKHQQRTTLYLTPASASFVYKF